MTRLEQALGECESARLEYQRVLDRYTEVGKELAFAMDQLADAIVEVKSAMNEELDHVN